MPDAWLELSGYLGLFLAAFGAATLLPMQSEAVLVGLLLTDRYAAWALLTVATTGNVLGSAVNWLLGRSIERYRQKRWFPVSERKLEKAQQAYHRFGRWSLLLSWVPIIGDPLTVVAGIMREPFWSFLLIVTLAKTARYLLLAAVTLGWFI
jgi:membrane protein YqaA with SNARE-associated domain